MIDQKSVSLKVLKKASFDHHRPSPPSKFFIRENWKWKWKWKSLRCDVNWNCLPSSSTIISFSGKRNEWMIFEWKVKVKSILMSDWFSTGFLLFRIHQPLSQAQHFPTISSVFFHQIFAKICQNFLAGHEWLLTWT